MKIPTPKRWLAVAGIITLIFLLIYLRPYSWGEDAYTQNLSEVRIGGIDVILYYAALWQDLFAGYPIVVQICYTIVILSCLAIILLFINITWDMYAYKRYSKRVKRIENKYYRPLKEVCEDFQSLTKEEIIERTEYETEKWTKDEMFIWISLFIRLRAEVSYYAPESNFKNAISMIGLLAFIDNELTYGPRKNKVKLMQALLYLNGEMSESTLVSLVNDRNIYLRKTARIFYMWLSKDDPYRFFEEDANQRFPYWDQLEMHQLFENRLINEKDVPSFVPLLKQIKNPDLAAFMIREIGYWGDDEDMKYVMSHFDSSDVKLRKAAFECVGIRRFAEAEPKLMDIFYEQLDSLRCVIMDSIVNIGSGKAVDFLCKAYQNCTVNYTRRTALRSLWLYGEKGQEAFIKLKKQVLDNDLRLFEHVESKIINNDF